MKPVKEMTLDEIVNELSELNDEIGEKVAKDLFEPFKELSEEDRADKVKLMKELEEDLAKSNKEFKAKYKEFWFKNGDRFEPDPIGLIEYERLRALEDEIGRIKNNLWIYTSHPSANSAIFENSLIVEAAIQACQREDEDEVPFSPHKLAHLNPKKKNNERIGELETRGLFLAKLKNKIFKADHEGKKNIKIYEEHLREAKEKAAYELNLAEMRFKCANEGLFEVVVPLEK